MPRYNVEINGKWACFSTITDSFVSGIMPIDVYEAWREQEYGRNNIPLERANQMPFVEALERMWLNNSPEDFCENLVSCGILERKTDWEDDSDD